MGLRHTVPKKGLATWRKQYHANLVLECFPYTHMAKAVGGALYQKIADRVEKVSSLLDIVFLLLTLF